jgi:hypothetical protein
MQEAPQKSNTNKSGATGRDIYSSGFFSPVIEKCDGCDRIIEVDTARYCRTYAAPAAKWKAGICNFATHVKPEISTAILKVNPLKAAKRASRRKK